MPYGNSKSNSMFRDTRAVHLSNYDTSRSNWDILECAVYFTVIDPSRIINFDSFFFLWSTLGLTALNRSRNDLLVVPSESRLALSVLYFHFTGYINTLSIFKHAISCRLTVRQNLWFDKLKLPVYSVEYISISIIRTNKSSTNIQ